jgi:hypothetical protein
LRWNKALLRALFGTSYCSMRLVSYVDGFAFVRDVLSIVGMRKNAGRRVIFEKMAEPYKSIVLDLSAFNQTSLQNLIDKQ